MKDKGALPLAMAKASLVSVKEFRILAYNHCDLAKDTVDELIDVSISANHFNISRDYVGKVDSMLFIRLVDIVERAVAKERAF